jgi:hypothetical protein
MADHHAQTREEIKALSERLEAGISELYESEKYAAYLKTMSKFHSYSTRNTMLIYLQMPDASQVAGFNTWEKKFSRHVSKGQKKHPHPCAHALHRQTREGEARPRKGTFLLSTSISFGNDAGLYPISKGVTLWKMGSFNAVGHL